MTLLFVGLHIGNIYADEKWVEMDFGMKQNFFLPLLDSMVQNAIPFDQ